ncbi:hypothetical protein C5Y97_20940 [Blastopirellula marina]|uniref:Glycosyltransferase RgtA/B/C/D-like domain-containing protein n=2 Tax=Blastopirellula marina TaxID=124 RepID=A0A2S8FFD8_9BACT|nr:hypothetical protein C5Y98_20930 [Blastopirellula marina]PTL42710.1 hypothetical protein C5Y97_20940 [Blastopirellula marina]
MLGAILLAAAMALTPNVADPDLWGHVQYGADVLREGLPATTTYSYTAEGYRWINHENLSEIALALGAETIGPVGLLWAKCLLGLAIVGVMLWRCESQQTPLLVSGVIVLLVALNFTNHWNARPQLSSFAMFTLLILLLDRCFAGWRDEWRLPWLGAQFRRQNYEPLAASHPRMKALWLCVPLFFIWANSHGGFVAGYAVFVAYLVCRFLELSLDRGWQGAGMMRRLSLMAVVGGLATLINPYGPNLHGWLLASLGTARPEITEWHPLYELSLASFAFFALLAALAFAILLSRKPLDFTQLAITALVAWQATAHQRHTPFLAILFGLWYAPHFASAWSRCFGASAAETDKPTSQQVAVMGGGLAVVYLVLIAALFPRLSEMPTPRDQYPVSAIQYMADQHLQGRLVATYNWAQYAIHALAADGDTQLQFDGRFRTSYPQEVLDMHFDLILGPDPKYRNRSPQSGPPDAGRVLEYGRPDLVLIDRGQPYSTEAMSQHADQWTLLYQDSLAQLWGRRDEYGDPSSTRYVPPQDRQISEAPQLGAVSWPAHPVARRNVARAQSSPSIMPARSEKGK